ncbi:MAG: hypothetical protein ACO3ZW_00585 [Opitutales bacterium]|jgi:hypothetical protein
MRSIHNFLLLIPLSILLAGPVCADDGGPEKLDPGPFYGFWQFQEPAGDTCILIVKRGGRVSCFWAGTATRAIEKGSWERRDNSLTVNWEAGHLDVYNMLGDNAIERLTYNAGQSLLGEPALTIRGVRVDSRIPGSLTVKGEGPPPEREQQKELGKRPAIPVNSPFVGYWQVDQSTGIFGIGGGEPNFYLQLSRNGDAMVALRDWEGDQGVRGSWQIEDGRAVITWPNNSKDVIFQSGSGHSFGSYKAKDGLDRKPRNVVKAVKVIASEAERYFEAGNFNRLTVVDIRGTWTPVEPTGIKEYISIEGWGNAYRHPARDGAGGTDPGKWRLESDRIFITWIDGSKDVIRLAFPSFIQDSYGVGISFSGKPERSIDVVRTANEE